jgi:hypothetical protein
MTDEAMSPLRRRMIEDMTIRKLSPKTQQGYIRTIKNLAVFLGRSPDTASFEDIRCFQLHLASSGAGTPILNLVEDPDQLAHYPVSHSRDGHAVDCVRINIASDVPYASLVPKRVEQRDCSRDHDSKRVVSGRPGKFSKAVALVAET